jgi:hypothetical protein
MIRPSVHPKSSARSMVVSGIASILPPLDAAGPTGVDEAIISLSQICRIPFQESPDPFHKTGARRFIALRSSAQQ